MRIFHAPQRFRLQGHDQVFHTYGPGVIADPPAEHVDHWYFQAMTVEQTPQAEAPEAAAGDPPADPPADPKKEAKK